MCNICAEKKTKKKKRGASGLKHNAKHLTKSGTLFRVCPFKAHYYNAKTYAITGDATLSDSERNAV